MMPGLTKRRLPLYLFYGILSGTIFYTVEIASTVRKFLTEKFGNGIYDVTYAVIGILVVAVFYAIAKEKSQRGIRISAAAIIGMIYFFLLQDLKYSVEKIHYIEYGLLTLVAARALRNDFQSLAAALLSLMMTFLVGLADEFLQFLNPNRVGEFRDIFTNLNAGFWALLLTLTTKPFSRRDWKFAIKDEKWVSAGVLLCLATAWGFTEKAHGFGYVVTISPEISFYSSFEEQALAQINSRVKKGAGVEPLVLSVYENEAGRHIFQRNFYQTNRFFYSQKGYFVDFRKSMNENKVLERLFSGHLLQKKAKWPADTLLLIEKKAASLEKKIWRSRVKGTLITEIPRKIVRGGFFLALFLFSGGTALLFFRRNPKRS